MNPIYLTMVMNRNLAAEQEGPFKLVYDEMRKFEDEFPQVIKNQGEANVGNEAIEYSVANLLYAAHTSDNYPEPPKYSRKDYLTATRAVSDVPCGRSGLIGVVIESFPQAVFCAEHLFFQNRTIARKLELPDADRPEYLKGAKAEDWVIPGARVDHVRNLAIDIWRSEEQKGVSHADEDE